MNLSSQSADDSRLHVPFVMTTTCTLHRYLPELVRYINLNQLCPYLVSERLISLAVCKELLQPLHTSRQYCIVSLVDAMESTGQS